MSQTDPLILILHSSFIELLRSHIGITIILDANSDHIIIIDGYYIIGISYSNGVLMIKHPLWYDDTPEMNSYYDIVNPTSIPSLLKEVMDILLGHRHGNITDDY